MFVFCHSCGQGVSGARGAVARQWVRPQHARVRYPSPPPQLTYLHETCYLLSSPVGRLWWANTGEQRQRWPTRPCTTRSRLCGACSAEAPDPSSATRPSSISPPATVLPRYRTPSLAHAHSAPQGLLRVMVTNRRHWRAGGAATARSWGRRDRARADRQALWPVRAALPHYHLSPDLI